jgi:hypothetical protein
MDCAKIYRIIAALTLFASCSEGVIVSDADSLGLRFKVKSMDESFYLAYNSFDNIVLYKKIYHHTYQFYYDSRYKSVEKNFYYNKLPHDSIINLMKSDSASEYFPFAFKEPEYYFMDYKYVCDSLTVIDIFDKHGNLTNCINRKYADNRLLSEEKYAGSRNLISKSKYWYNSGNQLINKTVFYENGYRETNYTYPAGEKRESGDEFNYRYKFDINSRISSVKTYRGIAFVSETRYYYNDYGNVIMSQERENTGNIKKTQYDYAYDSSGNWILCVEHSHSGNIFVRKRNITYYN